MQVDIDFHYMIKYWPVRKVNARFAIGASSTSVTVPHADPLDAPMVARVANGSDGGYFMMGTSAKRFMPLPDGSPREIRLHAGRHYVEWGPAEAWRAAVGGDGVKDTLLGHAYPYRDPAKVTTLEELIVDRRKHREEINRHEDDHGASVAASLAAWSSRCLVIGDRMFEETSEPVLRIGYGRACVAASPVGDRDLSDWSRGSNHEFFESLPDAESLRSRCTEGEWPTILDVDPRGFGFDGASYDTVRSAGALKARMGENAMALDPGQLEAFCVMREELTACGGRVTHELLAAIETVAYADDPDHGQMAEVAAWHDLRPQRSYNVHTLIGRRALYAAERKHSSHRESAREILDRWDERVRSSHWSQGSGPVAKVFFSPRWAS